MNSRTLRFTLAWLASIVVGCTSAPVRYYTLSPPPAKTGPASETTLTIDVRVVRTPPQLNRSELMVRTGPTEVTLLENEKWASPVKDEIKAALRLELGRRLGQMSGLHPTFAKLTLDIDVQRLEAELGQYALLEASWSATLSTAAGPRSAAARTTSCTFQADEKIHTGYVGMVEGYQREIAALADAIVAVLTSAASGAEVSCPKSIEGSDGGSGSKDHQAASIAVDLPSPAADVLIASQSRANLNPFATVDGLGIRPSRTALKVCMGVSTISLTSRIAAPPPMDTSRQPPQASIRTNALV